MHRFLSVLRERRTFWPGCWTGYALSLSLSVSLSVGRSLWQDREQRQQTRLRLSPTGGGGCCKRVLGLRVTVRTCIGGDLKRRVFSLVGSDSGYQRTCLCLDFSFGDLSVQAVG